MSSRREFILSQIIRNEKIETQNQSQSLSQTVKIENKDPSRGIKVDVPTDWLLFSATVAGTLFGVILGSVFTWVINEWQYNKQQKERKKDDQISNTINMLNEFNSESMSRDRNKAYKLLVENHIKDGSTPEDLVTSYERSSDSDEFVEILRIIDFYQGLDLLKQAERLNDEMATTIFSVIYTRWFDNYFKHQIVNVRRDWEGTNLYHEWLYNDRTGKTTSEEFERLGIIRPPIRCRENILLKIVGLILSLFRRSYP